MYVADSQWLWAAALQLGWMILLSGLGSDGAAGHTVWQALLPVLEWSGGIVDGRGDERTLLAAALKLGALFVVADAAWGRLRGRERAPWSIARVALVHGLVALGGWTLVAMTAPDFAAWLVLLFALLCMGGAAWAMACRRVAQMIVTRMASPQERALT
jgi:hypothetical protein